MNKDNSCKDSMVMSEYVQCKYKDKTSVTIGRTDGDNYALCIRKMDADGKETTTSLFLPETTMTGILTSMLIFAETYGIDINEKIRELIQNDNIFYYNSEPVTEVAVTDS